jgi:hypothetical protein
MFAPKNILFIPQYQFKNGTIRDKILIILTTQEGTSIVYTLTTSQDTHIPDKYKQIGCINDGLNFSMYTFPKDIEIGYQPNHTPFSFSKETYILFNTENINEIAIQHLLAEYPNTYLLATLNEPFFDNFMNCLKASQNIKRKYQRIFAGI